MSFINSITLLKSELLGKDEMGFGMFKEIFDNTKQGFRPLDLMTNDQIPALENS